jgi:hypothetical protein
MIDISNEGLLNNNNNLTNNNISFDSISEKQEESSYSSSKISKNMKTKLSTNNNRSNLKSNNDISKDIIDISNISIKKRPNAMPKKTKKSIKIIYKQEEFDKGKEKIKNIKRATNKKKTQMLGKRISFQHDNHHFFLNRLKNIDESKKERASGKNIVLNQPSNTNINSTFFKEKKSLNISMNQHKINTLTGLYSKNSIIGISTKNKSVNLSNSDYLDMKYFHNKKMKHTTLAKGKFNLKEERNMNSTILFEKLKESYLFEKSEALLLKIKICYGFLALFSFLSILLEIIDVIIFNKKSEEYLDINYNITIINYTNIDIYHLIENRTISERENSIRTFNLIFSLLCFFLHLIIHFIKNNFDKETKKKKKKNNYYKYYNRRRKTAKVLNELGGENRVKIINNDDSFTKNFVTSGEKIKLVINCIISLIFYPPRINKVFIGIQHNILYVYSLNSIFLLATFFKFSNIYFAFYYLSPFNNLLYKTICSSNMVKMDFKFMLRFLLNFYPVSFIIINFILIGISVCILLYCVEYFSINIYYGIDNNKGRNEIKNFYNEIFLYLFFVIKSVHGNIRTETINGSLILLVGGTIGLVINSYLIYYISQLIEFKPEEQQAFTKLVKLLKPANNEHKASNLVKAFLLMKKMYVDNKKIEEEYKLKKENNFQNLSKIDLNKSKFNFGLNESNNSISYFGGNNEYKEKKKMIKYISTQFILKIKLINEIKNFKNNLLIARNNSLSFNDVLKTLGDKMNGNINQLNSKIEILIQNDQKFKNFMKFQDKSIKRLKKIYQYQDFILNFLITKNNDLWVDYLKENKEMQNDFLNKLKNAGQGGFRRMKSSFNGQFFAFNKKQIRKGSIEVEDKKNKLTKTAKELFEKNEKPGCKRLRSSIVSNISHLNTKHDNIKKIRSKTNPIKGFLTNRVKIKAKSFDDSLLNVCKSRYKNNKVESNIMNGLKQKRLSLSIKQNGIIEKWKNKIEKK